MEKPSKPNIRRTRSGCWNCKKRRRRCTEDKPSCKGCLQRGQECHYGIRLLWEDEAQSMGIAFGRSGMKDRFMKTKIKSTVEHYLLPVKSHASQYWLTTTSEDIRLLYEGYPDTRPARQIYDLNREMSAEYLVPRDTLPLILCHHPSLEESDNLLFHYFSNICTLRRSLTDSENPWRSVLLPMCFQSDGLLHIAIAWAAHSLRNQCDGRDIHKYDQMILKHKVSSLKHLRDMLPKDHNDQPPTVFPARTRSERDSLLLLVMFHCLLEIASGSVVEWTYHMKGAIRIMKFYTTNCSSMPRREIFSKEVLELVYTFFIEKNIFLGTCLNISNEGEDSLDGIQWSTEVPSVFPFLAGRGRMEVNPCMGLSPELLDIIFCISDHARRRRVLGHCFDDNDANTRQIFETIQQRLCCIKPTESPNSNQLMELHSTAFEEATWIYLYHAIKGEPYQSEIIQSIHLPRIINALEQIHKAHGAQLGFLPYPMWALFIASCFVLEDDRVKILEFFTVLKYKKPISNVPSTMAAVEAIWKKRDLSSDETTMASSRHAATWTHVISQLGWMMPFT
ncbi:hypothetical protein N7536_005377 [Penicillium majusculum]|uniref:Zn(2)-C6 fungal-type domain-containing protein n=1 Tax=Penicillium solitum TaxID=60172 RepID=A0A1V6RQW4_9EURO|nr:uncharacterized protein PENSOL_c001G05515 [Penicillium solitum]KAJ5694965.1 hypothetical protein N7536_005377 [Penicillium majusculum]OQE04167.1 hypothetical protein PENSOL_c001G05515 [Penicillium solitum]